MKETIMTLTNSILFLVFGFIAIMFFYLAAKIIMCPSWKYGKAQKKKLSGLAIDMQKNRWTTNEVISETAVKEILS